MNARPDDLPMTFGDAWRWTVALVLINAMSGDVMAAFIRGLTQ